MQRGDGLALGPHEAIAPRKWFPFACARTARTEQEQTSRVSWLFCFLLLQQQSQPTSDALLNSQHQSTALLVRGAPVAAARAPKHKRSCGDRTGVGEDLAAVLPSAGSAELA